MSQPALFLDDLSLSYTPGVTAVSGVTVTVQPGEAVALIGPNGAGKSTILRGILGLVPASHGTLRVLGTDAAQARAHTGYVPQSDSIDADFPVSVRQVVTMGLYRAIGPLRWPGRHHREAVDRALDLVGLSEHANKRFGELSGGQRQRAVFARAVVARPQLMLLDEPFNGLDAESREGLIATVNRLKAEGVAFAMSTHDITLAQQAAEIVLMINHQQIACGRTDETLTLEAIARTHPLANIEADTHSVTIPGHEGH
ncbi:MAG: ABC transporter ATP-binding protein [Microbacteriaceae bacterium]